MVTQGGKLELNWAQAVGSGLAALSSAVLLSTLGATGTVIGAALGSVLVTVGGAVYSHYLSLSRERMAAARSAALRVTPVRRGPRLASNRSRVEAVARTVTQAPERYPLLAASARGGPPPLPGDGGSSGTGWREGLRGLRWKPALVASLGVFVLVMGLIVSMELVTGRALSSYTGGTSADGPRTSISLLGSTTGSRDGGGDAETSRTTDGTSDRAYDGRSGDTSDSDAGAGSAGDEGGGSTAGTSSDSDAPQSDTSAPEPDADASAEPAPEPTPDTSDEPVPEPSEPAPTTQAPTAEAPAPSTGAAVGEAVEDSAS